MIVCAPLRIWSYFRNAGYDDGTGGNWDWRADLPAPLGRQLERLLA